MDLVPNVYINQEHTMSRTKRTSRTKITVVAEGPILPGSISTAKSQCGKAHCACKASPPKLHGTYYRWTGFLEGKRTTKTISKETASSNNQWKSGSSRARCRSLSAPARHGRTGRCA